MDEQQAQVERDVRIPDQRVDQAGPAPLEAPVEAGPAPTSTAPLRTDGWQHLPWRTVARVSLSRSVLTWVVTMLVLAVMPLAVGWTPRVIMSGSMEPSIHTGDVVVTRPVDGSEIGQGTVLTTVDPDKPGTTRTHRMVERTEDGLVVTKGDANPDADSSPVPDSDVLGAGILRVPFIGLPAYWLSVGLLAPVGLALVVLTGAVLGSFRPRTPRPADDPRRGGGTGAGAGGPHRPERRGRARGRRARRAGAAVTLTVATALVVSGVPGSYAAFSARATGPASSFAAGSQFHPYRDAVLADQPSLYWRLDDTAGSTAVDASGNGAAGTAYGAVTWGQPGALPSESVSTAAGLSGGFIGVGGASGSTRFSLEAWVRTTTTQGGPLVTLGNGSGNSVSSTVDRALWVGADGRVRFGVLSTALLGVFSDRDVVTSNGVVNDGAWHHVVATYAPVTGGIKLYVDGVAQQSTTATYTVRSRSGWSYRAGGERLDGWPGAPASTTLAGRVDEVAVYDGTALSEARVAAHLAASRT